MRCIKDLLEQVGFGKDGGVTRLFCQQKKERGWRKTSRLDEKMDTH